MRSSSQKKNSIISTIPSKVRRIAGTATRTVAINSSKFSLPFSRWLRLMMGEAFAIIGKQIFDSQSRKELVANIQSLRHRKFTVPVDFASSGFVGTSNQFLYIQCGYAKPAHFCTKVSHEYSSFRLLNCVYTLDYTLYCVKNQPFSEKNPKLSKFFLDFRFWWMYNSE